MDKLTPNENKIIKTLQEIKIEVCSKDLASLTQIHPNSIGRYIKKLTDKGFVDQSLKQIHNKRFRMTKISTSGAALKINEIIIKTETKPKTKPKTEKPTVNLETVETELFKDDIKSELRTMILNLVVRKVDYKRYNFNNPAEYRNKIMQLIELM